MNERVNDIQINVYLIIFVVKNVLINGCIVIMHGGWSLA